MKKRKKRKKTKTRFFPVKRRRGTKLQHGSIIYFLFHNYIIFVTKCYASSVGRVSNFVKTIALVESLCESTKFQKSFTYRTHDRYGKVLLRRKFLRIGSLRLNFAGTIKGLKQRVSSCGVHARLLDPAIYRAALKTGAKRVGTTQHFA